MEEIEQRPQRINPIGSGSPDISIVDAAIVNLSKETASLKKELDTQRSETKNIILGVLVAFVAIVVTVAIQVIVSNRSSDGFFQANLNSIQKINDQQIKLNDLENRFDDLRSKNSYLR